MGDPSQFHMDFLFFGAKVCRDAFIALTGIHANTLQEARGVATGAALPPLPALLGSWILHRPLAYMNARAWLLTYAKSHADSSPMNNKLWLPAGRKQDYYAVYFNDRRSQNANPAHTASHKYFLRVWRQELPFVELRCASGPFTHCGFCDFLHMLISEAKDNYVKDVLLRKLGQHYEFQAAQRMAMSLLFADSERCPREVLAIGWDKMDQAKTILPRVKALANTQFQKGGARLVVHLIGVHSPLWHRPVFYTVFENQVQGADMICSLMVDVLTEATDRLRCLPRRLILQADNTPKETKNTITLAMAVWVLAQLQQTRLQSIEFCYLIVGHTHDLIDAIFSFVSRALHACDVLSLPDMFSQLNEKMRRPPVWKHLRDVWGFRDSRPRHLTASNIKGIGLPHHLRVFWNRNADICIQGKRWLTSSDWCAPIVVCPASDVAGLREWWAPPLEPQWPQGFTTSAISWLQKLQDLLQQSGRDCRHLDHMRRIVRDELPEYLPSGESLDSKVRRIRRQAHGQASLGVLPDVDASSALDAAIFAAFPGSATRGGPFCVLVDNLARYHSQKPPINHTNHTL